MSSPEAYDTRCHLNRTAINTSIREDWRHKLNQEWQVHWDLLLRANGIEAASLTQLGEKSSKHPIFWGTRLWKHFSECGCGHAPHNTEVTFVGRNVHGTLARHWNISGKPKRTSPMERRIWGDALHGNVYGCCKLCLPVVWKQLGRTKRALDLVSAKQTAAWSYFHALVSQSLY